MTTIKRALILTPSPGFGELIRQVLGETGDYEGLLAVEEAEALEIARQGALDLAVVDAEFGAERVSELVEAVRQQAPKLQLILIPQEDDPEAANLAALHADFTLPSPFYLPDLITALEELFGPIRKKTRRVGRYGHEAPPKPKAKQGRSASPAPDWLQDVSQAAQYLTRLSLESASQAALITRGDQVWAYAGELPQAAAEELAVAVERYWKPAEGADLARFVHVDATAADYMLYATGLGGDFALALVFDAEISFSQMRSQAGELAQALASAAPERALAELEGSRASMGGATPPAEAEGIEAFDLLEEKPVAGEPAKRIEPQVPDATDFAPRVDEAPQVQEKTNGHLVFSYVLIPRLPNHQLKGDLASQLALWLPQLSVAFAWRLESMNIQPDFLQWTLSLPAGASPLRAARVMEEQLSERIFGEFARLQRENPSGEFWAPGALIVNGARPSTAQITAFIKRTRAEQGIPSSE